jgi:hypothetical protein
MTIYQPIPVTAATLSLKQNWQSDSTIVASRAAGIVMTLPASTGNGTKFKIEVQTTITSNSLIVQVANATDVMTGTALVAQDAADTAVIFETASTSDTITMNGTTTGGIRGDIIELEDVAAGFWSVSITASATGTEATPFSAAVS